MVKKINAVVFKDDAAIICLAVIISFGINLFNPKGFMFVERKTKSRQIITISAREANNKFILGCALFLDSRNPGDFKKGHIKWAFNIPAHPVSLAVKKIKEHIKELSGPRELVIYCAGDSCGASRTLCEFFIQKGYKRHLYILKDGYPGWKKSKFPVSKD